jgi:hypothetical protein
MHREIKALSSIAGEARDAARELKIRIEEKVATAEREHDDFRDRIHALETRGRVRRSRQGS